MPVFDRAKSSTGRPGRALSADTRDALLADLRERALLRAQLELFTINAIARRYGVSYTTVWQYNDQFIKTEEPA